MLRKSPFPRAYFAKLIKFIIRTLYSNNKVDSPYISNLDGKLNREKSIRISEISFSRKRFEPSRSSSFFNCTRQKVSTVIEASCNVYNQFNEHTINTSFLNKSPPLCE